MKVVGVFPDDSHPPIIYPVALTVNAKPEAAQYLGVPAHAGRPIDIRGLRFQFPDKANVVTKLCASRA